VAARSTPRVTLDRRPRSKLHSLTVSLLASGGWGHGVRKHPRFQALPPLEWLRLHSPAAGRFVRQECVLWSQLHAGVLTTSVLLDALGLRERAAGKRLGVPKHEVRALPFLSSSTQGSWEVSYTAAAYGCEYPWDTRYSVPLSRCQPSLLVAVRTPWAS
jgi:hypothetical protein